MIGTIVHTALHFIIPGLTAWLAFRKQWQKAWLIMICTMLVDLDHLLATPIFDPNRCSIGFHPLHSYAAICIYCLMAAVPRLRIIAVGLLIHMGLDFTDCLRML